MTRANAASVSPTDTPGAEDAIPITVSCATPIASGSRRGAGVVTLAATSGTAELMVVVLSGMVKPSAPRRDRMRVARAGGRASGQIWRAATSAPGSLMGNSRPLLSR